MGRGPCGEGERGSDGLLTFGCRGCRVGDRDGLGTGRGMLGAETVLARGSFAKDRSLFGAGGSWISFFTHERIRSLSSLK